MKEMNTITCTSLTSVNPYITLGKTYEIIEGSFGKLIKNDKGEKMFIPSSNKIRIAPWALGWNWAIFS